MATIHITTINIVTTPLATIVIIITVRSYIALVTVVIATLPW